MNLRTLVSRLSISTRLALWYGLSLLILLTVFVAGLYITVHVGLHRAFDERLWEEAETVRDHLMAHGPDAHALSLSTTEETTGPRRSVVRLIAANGEIIETNADRPARSFDPRVPSTRTSDVRRHSWEGRAAHTLYLPIDTPHSSVRWVEVTKLESGLHRQLHQFRWLLVLGILLGSTGAVGIGYGLARRALRPVAALTDSAQSMMDRPTGTLPTEFGVKDELSDLAETFNALFRRLRAMVDRERRFREDAAHKMFTPLTALQNEIDVTIRTARSRSEYQETLTRVREHTEELSGILDRLMTLSRVEQRSPGPAGERIDVTDRVRDRIDRVRTRARQKDVTLSLDLTETAWAAIEPRHLDTIVDALLDNALKYTGSSGRVNVRVQSDPEGVRLEVADTGIGFEDDADRLFDRFYRSSGAEERASGRGLGLSIVQALARSYEGSVAARSEGAGCGSTFEVCIPRGAAS